MGLVMGLLGLAYLGVTGKLTELIFGDPRIEAWSGDWWWVAFTAAGGLVVAALRAWWKTPTTCPAASPSSSPVRSTTGWRSRGWPWRRCPRWPAPASARRSPW